MYFYFFFFIVRRRTECTLTDTLFPYTTLCLSIEGADAVALERGDARHQRHTIGQIAAFGSETAGVRRQLGEHEVAARGGGMAGPVEAERRARAGVPDEEIGRAHV